MLLHLLVANGIVHKKIYNFKHAYIVLSQHHFLHIDNLLVLVMNIVETR